MTKTHVARFSRVTRGLGALDDLTDLAGWERERLSRLRVEPDRSAFAAAHRLVRDCLLELAGTPLPIAASCPGCGAANHGRPYVPGRDDLHVSLSHSGRWVAAIAATTPCGIDVQTIGQVPDGALTTRERVAAPDDRTRSLLWARKEALVKAGLAAVDGFGELDVLDPDPLLHDWERPGVVGAWTVRSSLRELADDRSSGACVA